MEVFAREFSFSKAHFLKNKTPRAQMARSVLLDESILQTKLLIELFNASAGIDQLLLACIEGVTLGANLNCYVLLCRACNEGVAAVASNSCLVVLRMDSFSHDFHLI